MEVPTLYQLAFNKTCLHLWNNSPLASLDADISFKYRTKYLDHENKDIKAYQQKSSVAIENIEKTLERTGKVPPSLRQKIMNAVDSVKVAIAGFALSAARNMARKTLPNIAYCIQHIVFTQKLTIDTTESLLNILKTSKFDIEFTKKYLGYNCVKKSKVQEIHAQVCKEIKTSGKTSKKKTKRSPRQTANEQIDKAAKWIQSMDTGKKFWEKSRRKDDREDANTNMMYATDMQYVAVFGGIDALKYYYELACKELKGQSREQYILDCAKYMFLLDSYSGEKINFFYEKLNPVSWKTLVEDEFELIFLTYLRNWRYRDRCMPLFHQFKHTFDKQTFDVILRDVDKMMDCKYDRCAIMAIIKEVWAEMPGNLKTDSDIAYTYLPKLMVSNLDFDTLPFFLKYYSVEVQEDIMGRIVFLLVTKSQEDHIDALLGKAKELGLTQTKGKEFLTADVLKNCLIHDAERYEKTDLNKVTKYICDSKKEVKTLKKEVIQDKHFLVDFCVNMKSDCFRPLLNWAMNEDIAKLSSFKRKLAKNDLIQDIYERRLLQFGIYDADRTFDMLYVSDDHTEEVKRRVKDNTFVLHGYLQSSMHEQWFSLDRFFKSLSIEKKEQRTLMREFLNALETREAVYDMLLDLPHFEESFKCSKKGSQLMLEWLSFIKDIVKPYINIEVYTNELLGDCERVVREMYEKVQRHPKFGKLDEAYAKSIINARLRCFTTLFDNEYADIRLQNTQLFEMTDTTPFMSDIVNRYYED